MIGHEHNWRYSIVSAIFVLPLLIVVQMVRIRVDPEQAKKFEAARDGWIKEPHLITPARGQIYDRWGNLLAGNQTVYEVGVELRYVKNAQTIALTLKTVLDADYAEVFAIASIEPSPQAVYAVLIDNVKQDRIDDLEFVMKQMEQAYGENQEQGAPSLEGLVYKPHLGRIYPENTLASNVLGFVSSEGQGYFGVEERYNDMLAGKPKIVMIPKDPNLARERPEVPAGASLVLTLDRAIQRSMEEIIDAAIAETGAASGTLVVMDPRSGEVLAVATTPRLNLNEFWRYSDLFPKATPFNRALSQAYEPGSVFKVFTMASALDAGAVTPETVFVDTGVIEVGGVLIHNWNSGAWGPQDMQGCLQHSLNVCLAWVATQTGATDLYRYLQAFGIGHTTGVDMAGETPGRLKIPGDSDWYAADLGTNSFGQGVSATPIQMAAGISAIANDGKMMAPHIVRSVVNEGYQHNIEQRVLGMPISAETAHILSEMLARSLETESSDALVTGYRVAGKTGTAEIPTPYGYTTNQTNASFVGWGPVDDPRFLVYVWLEKPGSSPWGSVVAAPVFRRAVESLVVLLNLPPDEIRLQLDSQ
ncbi:MAG: penicillin-binding protein 2 [Anaerolineales bacterium]|nr:penicillin-binding protein 2 [Anaerolineales bacterium]